MAAGAPSRLAAVNADLSLAEASREALAALPALAREGSFEMQELQSLSETLALPHDFPRSYRSLPGDLATRTRGWIGTGQAAGPRQRALLLALLAGLEQRAAAFRLPALFELEWARLAARLLQQNLTQPLPAVDFEDDGYRKDLALLLLRLIPCRSHVVHPNSGLPRRLLFLPRNWMSALRWQFDGGIRPAPAIENHVHTRMLADFSPAGREQCYRLAAALLLHWPEQRGLMGSSWLYDSVLSTVSPNLRYLSHVPAQHGAVFLVVGATHIATRDATVRSESRRAAIAEGRYRPRVVAFFWPRERLIQSPWGRSPSAW